MHWPTEFQSNTQRALLGELKLHLVSYIYFKAEIRPLFILDEINMNISEIWLTLTIDLIRKFLYSTFKLHVLCI